MTKPAGNLYTISAPSGAGKTSLVKELVEQDKDITVSISYTTRERRPGEEHGVNYFFVDQSEFSQMIDNEDFLEHATVFGNSYGTTKKFVLEKLEAGFDVVLEIDWQGARQTHTWARLVGKTSTAIFILPPSLEELHNRLVGRGQDDEAVIEGRMAEARAELSQYVEADYLVVNDDFESALADLKAIVRNGRLAFAPQCVRHKTLIDTL